MPVPISADEVFEMACQIERDGAEFYRRARNKAPDPWAAEMLAGLADMEVEHEKTFASMRAEFAKGGPLAADDEQAAQYLRALARGRVFSGKPQAAEALAADRSLADVLHTAIGLEKDSIVFYVGIRDAVPDARGKERIDAIVREEMAHIATLNEALGKLDGN